MVSLYLMVRILVLSLGTEELPKLFKQVITRPGGVLTAGVEWGTDKRLT